MSIIRNLSNMPNVSEFMKSILGFSKNEDKLDKEFENLIKIIENETILSSQNSENTLFSDKYRRTIYKTEEARKALRKQIISELYNFYLLKNDDEVSLGKGGARPVSGLKQGKTVYYVIGLPASGKSGICHILAEKGNALVLDSDLAKQKLPEFAYSSGASITHLESKAIIFGHSQLKGESTLLGEAIKKNINLVIPKIGANIGNVLKELNGLKNFGYKINLILVRLEREVATKRAYYRFIASHRYVPLALIYDGYSNNPTITYYDIQRMNKKLNLIDNFVMINTDVNKGDKAHIVECSGTNIRCLFEEEMIFDC